MADYAHPEVLVTTDWVHEHLQDSRVKLLEVDVDTKAYDAGHIPGAIGLNWDTQLNDRIRRDIVHREDFEDLMSRSGVANDDIVVLYGDHNNWFAAFGFWIMKIYGHRDVRMMNGGRIKWLDEDDKQLTTEVPRPKRTDYLAHEPDMSIRAKMFEVLDASDYRTHSLVDVRSPDEFTGKVIAPPGMNETAQRGGHIPGATSIPWASAVGEDGTFRSVNELQRIYIQEKGLDPHRPAIAYCRIGERSSHTWFVLRYLLGFADVKNYDGSWTEYGNLVNAPIEVG